MPREKSLSIQVIIPAAGKPTNTIIPNTTLSDTMVPINGKPVIGYIIEDLLQRRIQDIYVVLNVSDNHAKEYITKKFSNKCHIVIIENKYSEKGIGHSLFLASKLINSKKDTLIYLGDTIYKGNLEFKNDFLVVSKKYEESEKWCFVEKNEKRLLFINKPKEYEGKGQILCGLYFLTDSKLLQQATMMLEKKKERFEIKDILEKYEDTHQLQLVQAHGWYDCGNIENYYKARIDFLKVRKFNSIHYNDIYGYITKSGNNTEKLLQEINWYINTPNELKIFAPRLVDYRSTASQVQYSLEFYGYPSLADLFIFNSLDMQLWKIIIDRLFTIIELFKKYRSTVPYRAYNAMYIEKTKDRLQTLQTVGYWKALLEKPEIMINKKKYKNIFQILPLIETYVEKLYQKKDMTFIHGDLCISNILFDPSSRIFKFVDPGGRFGETGVYGDIKYDIAKLRHSFCGFYDFIISDLFEIEEKKGEFSYAIYADAFQEEVSTYFDKILQKNGFDLKKIKIIEGLLFISMIPLHGENSKHQKAMFCRGIEVLNEVLF